MVITIRSKKRRVQDRRRKEVNSRIGSKKDITDVKKTSVMSWTATIHPPPVYDQNDLPCLPQDLVLYNIISKLPIKALNRSRCVCKLWDDTIDHDPHFRSAHFIHTRKNSTLMFHIYNVLDSCSSMKYDFFYLKQKEGMLTISKKPEKGGVELSSRVSFSVSTTRDWIYNAPIGCCNGLVCVCVVSEESSMIRIFNPTRHQVLDIVPPIVVNFECIKGYGFGFDSLTHEYKVVCIIGKELEYSCMVYTLGRINSWRKVTCPGPCVLQSDVYSKSAISCDGALYFRIDDDPLELLSFDLHNEKFQLIEIPLAGLTLPQLWFQCLEFQGHLCFTSLEEFEGKNCKVHLLILKDRTMQGWIKETLFVPFPCNESTRIVCFSNRVLLYWFLGECFLFYDLYSKVPNVVKFPGGHFSKRRHLNTLRKGDEFVNYQLYSHVENSICLETLCSGD